MRQDGGEFGRQPAVPEFAGHAFDGQRLLTFFLQPGQRRLQDLGRRLAEAAAALAMEIHRRRVQAQQHGGHLHGIGFGAVVFGGQLLEAELCFAADLPQEIDVDALGLGFGTFQQFAWRGRGETLQHIGGLDLGALARGQLDLQRGRVVGQHGTGAKHAVFFKQDIHWANLTCAGRWRSAPCW